MPCSTPEVAQSYVRAALDAAGLPALSSAVPQGGGRNSRVLKLQLSDGQVLIAKVGLASDPDARERLQRESAALRLLCQARIATVPELVTHGPSSDGQAYVVLTRYVKGTPILAQTIGAPEVDQLVLFLDALLRLGAQPAARALGPASDAALCLDALIAATTARRARLAQAAEHAPELAGFLARHDEAWGAACAALSAGEREAVAQPVLSPSDFGVHNTRRRFDGTLVFFDFEYFGWDDPAKLCCDTLLHPAHLELSDVVRARLATMLFDLYRPGQPDFARRVERAYPLHALKWCLILLNIYVAEYVERLRAVGALPHDLAAMRAEQLRVAGRYLAAVQGGREIERGIP